jgi:HSP20 family protein
MMKRDPHSWMWAEALRLLDRADGLHRQYCGLAAPQGEVHWEPPVDVLESPAEIQVTIALPGVSGDRIELQLEDPGITVRAYRPAPLRSRDSVVRRLEIPYGRFARHIRLPDGRFELLGHSLVDGCLHLRLRRI